MDYEQMEQHVGHPLTVGFVEEDGKVIAAVVDCRKCETELQRELKPSAVGTFTKVGDGWGVQVDNGQLEPGSAVLVEKRNGEQKMVTIGESVSSDRFGTKYVLQGG